MFFITHKAVGFKSQVSVLLSAAQSIPVDAWTLVEFDTKVKDGLTEFDIATHRFTVKQDGIYNLTAQVTINNNAVDKWNAVQVRKNGSTVLMQSYAYICITAVSGNALVFKPVSLVKDEYIEVLVRHNNIAAKDTDADQRNTYFTVERVA